MMVLKIVTIAAGLVVAATSFAMAQAQGSGGPDGMATSAAAADNPPKPSRTHRATSHKMYMSAGSTRKKGKTPTNDGY